MKEKDKKMEQNANLMESILEPSNLRDALHKVKANKGAAGIDNMKTEDLTDYLKREWQAIREKLLTGKYKPKAVKRVEIPKPAGGIRLLGIPTVLDRFIQQAMLQKLTPIFDPEFSENSYGFRPGRSAQDAVRQAKKYIEEGNEYVVDIDLEKFFDNVNHDILMRLVSKKIRDKRVLKLIGRYLRAGIMSEGVCMINEKGTPQGGVISPLLANIMLDELDKELESRGRKFCRYADDCNIYVKSRKAGERVKTSITHFLSKKLKLKVNESKSGVDKPENRKFLGFSFKKKTGWSIVISESSLKRMKDKIRELTNSLRRTTMEDRIKYLNRYLVGWYGYYSLAKSERAIQTIEGWLRRRLRLCRWHEWKNPKTRARELMKLGVRRGKALSVGYSSKGNWRISRTLQLHIAMGVEYWKRQGLVSLTNSS